MHANMCENANMQTSIFTQFCAKASHSLHAHRVSFPACIVPQIVSVEKRNLMSMLTN